MPPFITLTWQRRSIRSFRLANPKPTSIRLGQLALLTECVARLLHAGWPRVAAWRTEYRKVRKVCGETHQLAIQDGVESRGHARDLDHQPTPLTVARAVEPESLDEPLRLSRATSNAAVATNVDGAGQKNAKRVRNGLLSLPKVAGLANVEQIVVFEREAGIVHDRAKVIPMKMADAIHPLFAFEAVDAAKGELVAEPRSELDGAAVAAWAVLATVWP